MALLLRLMHSALFFSLFRFWLIQGGTEELITRGWLLPVMAEKSNKIIAIVVSSSLFGLLHMFNSGFTMQSLIDLILLAS